MRLREYPPVFNKEVKPTLDVETQFIKNQEQSEYWGNSKAFSVRLLAQPIGVFSTSRSVRKQELGVATIKISKFDTVQRTKESLTNYIDKALPEISKHYRVQDLCVTDTLAMPS